MATTEDLLNLALQRQNELYGLTAPLRQQGVSTLQGILQGAPTSTLPAYAPARQGLEEQYNTTAKLLQNSMPRGGQLNASLADLMNKRAGAVTNMDSSLRTNALNQALGLGFGGSATNMSATNLGVNTNMAEEQRKAQQTASAIQGGAQGLGLLLGLLGGWANG